MAGAEVLVDPGTLRVVLKLFDLRPRIAGSKMCPSTQGHFWFLGCFGRA